MSDARIRYAAALNTLQDYLHDQLERRRYPDGFICSPHRWDEYNPVVAIEKMKEMATGLRLPPAAELVYTPGENFAPELASRVSNITPGTSWRLVSVRLFDAMMRSDAWPFVCEEQVPDGWVVCSTMARTFTDEEGNERQHDWAEAFDFTSRLWDWSHDLSAPLNAAGIMDTPWGRETWDSHCFELRMRESNQCKFLSGVPINGNVFDASVPREMQQKVSRRLSEIAAKYDGARITAYYVKRAVELYLNDLDERYYRVPSVAKKYPPSQSDLKVLADWVHHYFRMARPLDLIDAPDPPGTDLMGPRPAMALLDKLRNCCIRRMKEEGDDRFGPYPKYHRAVDLLGGEVAPAKLDLTSPKATFPAPSAPNGLPQLTEGNAALHHAIDEVERIASDVDKLCSKFPRLHHATMDGFGVHDTADAREFIKGAIAWGHPFEQTNGKISTPHGFFYGADLKAREAHLDPIADRLIALFEHGGLRAFRPEPSGKLDSGDWDGPGHLVMRWTYWLHERHAVPIPRRSTGRVVHRPNPGLLDLQGQKLTPPDWPEAGTLFLPNEEPICRRTELLQSEDDERRRFLRDEFSHLLTYVRDGWFEDIDIMASSVFATLRTGLNLLLQTMRATAAANGSNVPPSDHGGAAAGPATEPEKPAPVEGAHGLTKARLRELVNLSDGALDRYIDAAKVPKAGRGGQHYKYPIPNVERILNAVVAQSTIDKHREAAKRALLEIRKSTFK
ncbi:MAG: hypothetical protein JWO31_4291 [Phycisphaerales bacterium]|nr:hypothetical protein [Phycisphaerales bacterium]